MTLIDLAASEMQPSVCPSVFFPGLLLPVDIAPLHFLVMYVIEKNADDGDGPLRIDRYCTYIHTSIHTYIQEGGIALHLFACACCIMVVLPRFVLF